MHAEPSDFMVVLGCSIFHVSCVKSRKQKVLHPEISYVSDIFLCPTCACPHEHVNMQFGDAANE